MKLKKVRQAGNDPAKSPIYEMGAVPSSFWRVKEYWNGRCGGIRTHTGPILSRISLPLEYTPK